LLGNLSVTIPIEDKVEPIPIDVPVIPLKLELGV
jgi:hypothetical protein